MRPIVERLLDRAVQRGFGNVDRVRDPQRDVLGGRPIQGTEVNDELAGRRDRAQGIIDAVDGDLERAGPVEQTGTRQRPTTDTGSQRLGEHRPGPRDGGRAGDQIDVDHRKTIAARFERAGRGATGKDSLPVADGRLHLRDAGDGRTARADRFRYRLHPVAGYLTRTAHTAGLGDGPNQVRQRLGEGIRKGRGIETPGHRLSRGARDTRAGRDRSHQLKLGRQEIVDVYGAAHIPRVLPGDGDLIRKHVTARDDGRAGLGDIERRRFIGTVLVHHNHRAAGEGLIAANVVVQGNEGDVTAPVRADRARLRGDIEAEDERHAHTRRGQGAGRGAIGVAKPAVRSLVLPAAADRRRDHRPEAVVLKRGIEAKVASGATGVVDGDDHRAGHRVAIGIRDRRRDLDADVGQIGAKEDAGGRLNGVRDRRVPFLIAARPGSLGHVRKVAGLDSPDHGKGLDLVDIQLGDDNRRGQVPARLA